ncbi:MAG: LytTR family DNA-binding domain-containing protein [Verrucomicrobiota bacterium JB022]|nr:LytTR family DNA-binding domain-containing protein [Verrucomicrobiota bacterium JB022]
MKALIVDDERLARNQLRRLLQAHPQVEIVGEASHAAEARERIAELNPELLFLDIQMPEETGFDLLQSLEPPVPRVIFTTAFDEYALKAFEVNALDYLLKPIDPDRLATALERVQDGHHPSPGQLTAPASFAPEDRVFIREGERCWLVEVKRIRLLESEGNYTRVHFDEEAPLLYRSLTAMEKRLDPQKFFRANRAQLINIEWIHGIEPWFSGNLKVTLQGGTEVEISRRQAQAFKDVWGL